MMRLATAMCGMLKVGSSSEVVSTCRGRGRTVSRRGQGSALGGEGQGTMKKIQYDLHTFGRISVNITGVGKDGKRREDAREADPRERDVDEVVDSLEEEEADLALRVLRVDELERVREGVDAGEERAVEPPPALRDESSSSVPGARPTRQRLDAPAR